MHLKPDMPVSMLTKLLRKEKDYEREYRGGSRGGKKLFDWNELKSMNFKERECYLGHSTQIGYLDKGGQWKHGQWYKRDPKNSNNNLAINEAKKKDNERISKALGINNVEKVKQDNLNFTQEREVDKLVKKIKKNRTNDKIHKGLGFKR